MAIKEMAFELAQEFFNEGNPSRLFTFDIDNDPDEIAITIVRRKKSLVEKTAGDISFGPMGTRCPTCGGSGRI